MNANLKYQMKNKVYIFHTDPGHGWFAVKLRELDALGIAGKISGFSYIKGSTAYLEEDNDAAVLFEAYRAAFGKEINYRTSHLERTPIRYYDRYSARRRIPDTTQPTWEDTARMWLTGDDE